MRNHGRKRKCILSLFLLVNAFSWYFMTYSVIHSIVQKFGEGSFKALCLSLGYPLSIIISAILGAIFLGSARKTRFFYIWILIGVMASASSATLSGIFFEVDFIVVIFLGLSLGLGMPSLLNFFSEVTNIENRGKISGLVLFATSISTTIFAIVKLALNQILYALFITCWRGWSLLPIFFVNGYLVEHERQKRSTNHFIDFIHNRTFLLYFSAWLMFTLVDGFGANITAFHGRNFYNSFKSVELIMASLSALISGVLSDVIGRKRVITLGFVSLGLAYAILGLIPTEWVSWFLFFIISGFAIGSLWTLFTMVIWGEVAERQIEKYYALGEAPYFLAGVISLVFAPITSFVPQTSAFSLAALFLFLAVVPLMFAPETLPEKTLRERELRIYIERAKRIRERFTKG